MTTMQSKDTVFPANRLSDSESLSGKLMDQIRAGQLSNAALDTLQARCTAELHQLRSELDMLLRELRAIAERSTIRCTIKYSAAA